MPPASFTDLIPAIKSGKFDNTIISKLSLITNKDQAVAFIEIVKILNKVSSASPPLISTGDVNNIIANLRLQDLTQDIARVYRNADMALSSNILLDRNTAIEILKSPTSAKAGTFLEAIPAYTTGLNLSKAGVISANEVNNSLRDFIRSGDKAEIVKFAGLYKSAYSTLEYAQPLLRYNMTGNEELRTLLRTAIAEGNIHKADELGTLYKKAGSLLSMAEPLIKKGIISPEELKANIKSVITSTKLDISTKSDKMESLHKTLLNKQLLFDLVEPLITKGSLSVNKFKMTLDRVFATGDETKIKQLMKLCDRLSASTLGPEQIAKFLDAI